MVHLGSCREIAIMFLSTLLTLLLVSTLDGQTSEVYQIVTNSTDHCSSPCYTFSQFATKISESNSRLRSGNISLIFKPGIHSLTVGLSLSNLYSFSMNKENSLTTAHIECASTVHVLLSSIHLCSHQQP